MKTGRLCERLLVLVFAVLAAGACTPKIAGQGSGGAGGAGPGSGVGGAGATGGGATQPVTCLQPPAGKRVLRLLSRREYRNTVRDLFAVEPSAPGGAAPTGDCGSHTFVYDPMGRPLTSVHVAGDFNQWAPTVAKGGWPLQYDATTKVWSVRRALSAGAHAYKFVLDERDWISDPVNPDRTPDGFGGNNSTLSIVCAPTGKDAPDLTATFPVESKPRKDNLSDLFPFDNTALQVVSPVHIEEYWQAAAKIAQNAGPMLAGLVPCNAGDGAAACLEKFVRVFGQRVFRRPLTDAEMTRYLALATASSSGRMAVVRALLSSPKFLYRAEGSEPTAGDTFRLGGFEVAAALSYQLWGSTPDQTLLDAAGGHQLDSAAGIEAQARRMLADPRSHSTIADFASQWLGVEEIATADKDVSRFPAFSNDLRAAMVEETRRFASHVVFDSSRTFAELLLANYTFVNQPLASFYGLTDAPPGTSIIKQPYQDKNRSGLLGHAGLLGVYARSDQTSPIKRGLFVRRRLLCQDLPPPPADVPPVPSVDQNATTRERFRQHTSEPGCAVCHQFIDQVGFGFEHFDAIGRYRDTDNGQAVDSSGDMNDVERLGQGTHAAYTTLPELAQVLASSQAAPACFATQYLRFARGGFESPETACGRQTVQGRFRDSGFDIQELMVAATQTPDFVIRR